MPVEVKRHGFVPAVEAAAAKLVSVNYRKDGAFINLPLIYPSGSTVVVRVEPAGEDDFFVSDYGQGFVECDLIGATHQFKRHAPQIAENAGVRFDGNAFFVIRVSSDQLAGAAATIATCSLEAVTTAFMRLSEKRFQEDAGELHDRLISVFSARFVSKDVSILGASQTSWPVSNVVRLPDDDNRTTIFEPVTKHHASIAAATTKFHDIALLDNPPGRVAVVRRKADFGTYLGVLSQAANVITLDAPTSTLKRLAAAA